MSKRRRDKDPVPVMPQRFTWKTLSSYDNFEEADVVRNHMPNEKVKVKRRKDTFEVRLGTPIKKKD